MELDAKQREAVELCCDVTKRIVSVTGGAGTGKTTIIQHTYNTLVEAGYQVGVCAPTGKAAKRVREATGIPASTMHMMLRYTNPGERDPKTGKLFGFSFPRHDRNAPLPFDVIIGDEYAMVHHELHRNVVDALKPGGRLLTFGDRFQLRPIESDKAVAQRQTPFQDLLKDFPSVILETNHRQGKGSGIAEAGAAILSGRAPRRADDVGLIITEKLTEGLVDLVMKYDEDGIDFRTLDHQLIVPGKNGWIGVHKLNALMQTYLRPETDGWISLPRHEWDKTNPIKVRVGDKVINTKNIYPQEDNPESLECYNGEQGIIEDISPDGEITINLGDRVVVFPPFVHYTDDKGNVKEYDPRRELDLSYACTTHKAQGSEWKHVIYLIGASHGKYLRNRPNFYTGITRARTHVDIISDMKSLSYAVRNKGEFF